MSKQPKNFKVQQPVAAPTVAAPVRQQEPRVQATVYVACWEIGTAAGNIPRGAKVTGLSELEIATLLAQGAIRPL